MKEGLIAICLLALLLAPSSAQAGAPLDTIRTNVNQVLDVLRDPKLKSDAAKEVKKKKLEAIYEHMFDEVELAKRSLARNWNSMNATQRQEFVVLFRQVLEKAYIDKILSYTNEKIVFDREIPLAQDQVEVQTRIVTASREIPIAYRVILKGGVWKVYDVVVENVSLVLNYRTQFNEILSGNTPDHLLEVLRRKVQGQ
jgi:phospholipid transport system substrate-binding protein